MRRNWVMGALAVVGILCLVAVSQTFVIQPLRAILFDPPTHYLTGNLVETEGIATTGKGQQEGSFFGSIGFQVWQKEKEIPQINLSRLNFVSPGVSTAEGESGVISISLAESSVPLEYQPRTGELSGEVEAVLHYELIDRLRGYKKQECQGECDLFEPYTERLVGKFSARFAESLEPREEGRTKLEGEVVLQLSESILGYIREIVLHIIVEINWSLFEPADVLRIQPVFVGTGPSDSTASGTAFNTLMNYSHNMWNRCGDERCIKFVVNAPIYVNNNAYKILDDSTEAAAFRSEVNVANAIEVFVAREMSTSLACSWGGGACFSSGTAAAKIVSCDQQMAVPNPCPAPCTSYCPCGACLSGAINPYHLAHELGHALDLPHPPGSSPPSTVNSIMEPSGFCCDNPNLQSGKNCRNAANPLMFVLFSICTGSPDISD
ncbi:hypothetical protein ACFLSW_04345 [Candidatus Bipolaricaulota bacterium]